MTRGIVLFRVALVGLLLAVLPVSRSVAAPGTGTLYGTDGPSGTLLTVDRATGAGNVVGAMGFSPAPALAADPVRGALFAGSGAGLPLLYSVDSCTGSATLIGDTGLGFAAIGGMDFRADGTLFATVNIAGDGGTGSDHLATIDPATAATTVIGPYGACMGVTIPSQGLGSCTIEGMEAIAFDGAGTLYGAVNLNGTGAAGLYTIDPTTGAATFVAPIINAGGMPPGGGVVSLQFSSAGILYGGTTRTAGMMTNNGGDLVIIDPATGTFTLVGKTIPAGTALAALAFAPPCAVNPAPVLSPLALVFVLLVLLAVGAIALGDRRHRARLP